MPPEAARLVRLLAVGLHDAHALQRLRQHAAEVAVLLQRPADRAPDALLLPVEIEERDGRADQHEQVSRQSM